MRHFSLVCAVFLYSSALYAESIGFITDVIGDVWVNQKKIAATQPLELGANIQTKNGKCTVIIGRESIIHVDINTKLTLDQHTIDEQGTHKTEVSLKEGGARALVKSGGFKRSFQIRTKTATMGVRGTHVMAWASSLGKDGFAVVEGAADITRVGSTQPVVLKANEAVIVSPNAPIASNIIHSTTEESQKRAASIAPPPMVAMQGMEFKQVLENAGNPPPPLVDDFSERFKRQQFRVRDLPIDPNANGSLPVVSVIVKVRKR